MIEAIILYTSLIDGLLRIAIVLKNQLTEENSEIDNLLVSQDENGPYYSERKVIHSAFKKKVIDKDFYDEINELYDQRNKAVHRFFLMDIKYKDLSKLSSRYDSAFKRLYDIVYDLESEQIAKGIGMTVEGEMTEDTNREISDGVQKKIGSP